MQKKRLVDWVRDVLKKQKIPQNCVQEIVEAIEKTKELEECEVSEIRIKRRAGYDSLVLVKKHKIVAYSKEFHFSSHGSGYENEENRNPWLLTWKDGTLYVSIG